MMSIDILAVYRAEGTGLGAKRMEQRAIGLRAEGKTISEIFESLLFVGTDYQVHLIAYPGPPLLSVFFFARVSKC